MALNTEAALTSSGSLAKIEKEGKRKLLFYLVQSMRTVLSVNRHPVLVVQALFSPYLLNCNNMY